MAVWLTEDCLITMVTGARTIMTISPSFLTSTETAITTLTTGDLANRCLQSGCRAPSLKTEGQSHFFMLTSLDLGIVVCRPPGLVQSVLAPVIGLSSLNLAYSPGAKRIDVMARCEHVYSEKQESL